MKFIFIFPLLLFSDFLFANSFVSIDEPAGCQENNIYPCAVRTEKIGVVLQTKIGVLRLGANTSLQWMSPARVRLLEGLAYGEKLQGLELHFGRLDFKLDGDVWFQKIYNRKRDRNPRLVVKNFSGQVLIVKGPLEKENMIPAGFENWYAGYGSKNKFYRGLIRPIVWKGFTPIWVQMLQSKKLVQAKMLVYKDLWREAVQQSSGFYQEIALRGIASVEAREERERQEKAKVKKDLDFLRKLYRQKNNFE